LAGQPEAAGFAFRYLKAGVTANTGFLLALSEFVR
jgi:hypothetical protein